MNSEVVFGIMVVFLCADFLAERILERLNRRAMSPKLPDRLRGIYDEQEYARFLNYKKDSDRLGSWSSVLSFLAMLIFLLLGGFGWWNHVVEQWIQLPILQTLIFMFGLSIVSGVMELPFDWYATFHIEEKYGFNQTTKRTFWLDLLKNTLLSTVLGGVLLAGVVWFYHYAGELFWLYAWIGITIFSLFFSLFYSQLIVPLFNKQVPLENGSLRDKIEAFAQQVGFKLTDIYVIDGSRRSTKANAYFTGFGPKKRIVLYDTLMKELTEEEIVAVLAHEVGHYKRKHTIQFMLASILQTGLLLCLFAWFVNQSVFSQALGGEKVTFQLGLIAFAMLYSPISLVIGLLMNVWSRKNEYEADAFAAEHGEGEHLISGLKKISVKALSNLTPHPIYEWVHYSHPSLLKRINAVEQILQNKK